MRELRRPHAPVRNGLRRHEIEEASKPLRHAPLVPGKERETPVLGLPGLKRFEVISETDS